MPLDYQMLHDDLKAKNFADAKKRCCISFECTDAPIDELITCLTEHGFFEVCKVLDQVQGATPGDRQALKMGLQLVIDQDRPTADERARALRASEEIWRAFPPA